jgi:Peptidase family M28
MLDPRIYRAALVPVVLALIVCAFSLGDRPAPIRTTLAPDAFGASRALAEADALAGAFPERRPGSAADEALARRLAGAFRAMGSYQVSTPSFSGETIDGDRRLTTVIARQVGAPGPGLVVVAHRDAAARGARAELSGTAAMLELARVVGGGRLRRTVTFVSTSGGSGGLAGARDLPGRLGGGVDAVLVLGDLAGRAVRKPFVVGWSEDGRLAPDRLRRTVDAAVRAEARTEPGGPRAWVQWTHLAFPHATGEQGPLLAAGLPAVLLSASGERPPAAGEPLSRARLQSFGRAALRALTALDAGPPVGAADRSVVTVRKLLPAWAARLLVGSLLLAPVLAAVDGFARVRRRRHPVVPALAWIGAAGLAFVVPMILAALLGLTGLLGAAPPLPVPPGAIPLDGTAVAALVATALAFVLAWMLLRPWVLQRTGGAERLEGAGGGAALVLTWSVLAVALWVVNPFAAALMVPGAHALLFVAAPEVRLRRGLGVALALVAVVPFAAVDVTIARHLGAGPLDFAWWALLLEAGGFAGPVAWLFWSTVLACLVGGVALALRGRPVEGDPETRITVRGPINYAGPGSLGGTESALRR